MPLTCVICLETESTVPICLPCGHIFCEECMNTYISSSSSASSRKFSCPTCRKAFNTVLDPPHNPTIRKLYIPAASDDSTKRDDSAPTPSPTTIQSSAEYLVLLTRVFDLESRMATLKHDRDRLLKESELQQRCLKQSVDAQRLAKAENALVRKEAWDFKRRYEALKEQVRDQQYGLRRARELRELTELRMRSVQSTNVLRRPRANNSLKPLQGFDWKELVRGATRRP
ncbi:hypothetical protein HGRIS_005078 [Hohenbuehelia grisea]|uniref:RING-type domain-containing protein n=1 Tax=Hohenbuehelia grisea TaxID=104357 RepID=A0ABR3JER3_9AGAR